MMEDNKDEEGLPAGAQSWAWHSELVVRLPGWQLSLLSGKYLISR